jgi:hypothetical protein
MAETVAWAILAIVAVTLVIQFFDWLVNDWEDFAASIIAMIMVGLVAWAIYTLIM